MDIECSSWFVTSMQFLYVARIDLETTMRTISDSKPSVTETGQHVFDQKYQSLCFDNAVIIWTNSCIFPRLPIAIYNRKSNFGVPCQMSISLRIKLYL